MAEFQTVGGEVEVTSLVLKEESDRWMAFGVSLRARVLVGGYKARLLQIQEEQRRLTEECVRISLESMFSTPCTKKRRLP